MKPSLFLQIWPLLILVLIIFLVHKLIRFFKRRKGGLYTMLCLPILLILNSCLKEDQRLDSQTTEKMELLKELGFDTNKISFETKSPVKDTLRFKTKADAILYFKYLRETSPINFEGKYIGTINKNFDPIQYVKIRKNISSARTDIDDTDPDACLYPWWVECIGYDGGYSMPITNSGFADINQYFGWAGYHVGFRWEKNLNGQLATVDGYSSDVVGFTLGVSWTHSGGTSTLYPNSALIRYEVHGIQHYNIIIEGIGTVWSQPVKIYGTYNTNNGAHTMEVDNA